MDGYWNFNGLLNFRVLTVRFRGFTPVIFIRITRVTNTPFGWAQERWYEAQFLYEILSDHPSTAAAYFLDFFQNRINVYVNMEGNWNSNRVFVVIRPTITNWNLTLRIRVFRRLTVVIESRIAVVTLLYIFRNYLELTPPRNYLGGLGMFHSIFLNHRIFHSPRYRLSQNGFVLLRYAGGLDRVTAPIDIPIPRVQPRLHGNFGPPSFPNFQIQPENHIGNYMAQANPDADSSNNAVVPTAVPAAAREFPQLNPNVDRTTSIQVMLADGTRVIGYFDRYQNTIRDVRAFINSTPAGHLIIYDLLNMAVFPPVALTDFDQTIDEVGIAISFLVQNPRNFPDYVDDNNNEDIFDMDLNSDTDVVVHAQNVYEEMFLRDYRMVREEAPADIEFPQLNPDIDPTISIRVRLADGTRVTAHFNRYRNTVRDVCAFISSTPTRRLIYDLLNMAVYPPVPLTDDQIIDEAGIANSFLIQNPL